MTDTARRGWTLIAPTQTGKATTANDRFQDIENALDDLLSVDLTAASVTLTAAEWSASAGFSLGGTDTSGRTVTIPAQEGPRDFILDSAWTHSVGIVRGSTTVTLQPGEGVRVFADGSANGLRVVGRGQSAGLAFTNLTDTFASFSGKGGKPLRINAGATAVEDYFPPYDVPRFLSGAPTASQVLIRLRVARAVRFPAGLSGSFGQADTASTGTAVFSIRKNGSQFGTVTFTASASGVVAAASDANFAALDLLELVAPVTPDATLANIDFTISGLRI